MAIKHGIFVYEQATSIVAPVVAESAVQVVIGASPIHLGDESDALSVKVAYSYAEAVKKLGYSEDFERYPLCESIKASFEIYHVAPVVFINVLDPAKHTKTVANEAITFTDGKAIIEQEGILLSSLSIKRTDDGRVLTQGTDYLAKFSDKGYLVLEALEGALPADEAVAISYKLLDSSMLEESDLLAGIRKVKDVYPRLNLVPCLLLCPGWSHKPAIYAALTAQTENLNGMFRCMVLADLDSALSPTYDKCLEAKNQAGLTSIHSILCWPKIRLGDAAMHMSALLGAHMAFTDYQNESVPFVSPSNRSFHISGICGKGGVEITLDLDMANLLNGQGICTAINLNGWRFWGNYTAGYPGVSDVKDVFIPVRRMFSWWGNTFILTYFQKVDNPMNKRLIEAVVDSENIRANGFKARYQIADARMEYRIEENPQTDLLSGIIRFHQYLTPYPPAQAIINTLEFDPNALASALE